MFLSKDDGSPTVLMQPADGGSQCSAMLSEILADVMALQIYFHAAHWNVTGPDFAQYHDFFSEIYEDIEDSVDPLAENIRKLGYSAPCSMTTMMKIRSGVDPEMMTAPRDLMSAGMRMNEALIQRYRDAFTLADRIDEQGLADFLAGRIDMHQKWHWQLKASLENGLG